MIRTIRRWMVTKWDRQIDPALAHSYHMTFSTSQGQQVLKHLVDTVYCSVYEGTDPVAAACHNARRSVVHEILHNIDVGENPLKYVPPITERDYAPGSPAASSVA